MILSSRPYLLFSCNSPPILLCFPPPPTPPRLHPPFEAAKRSPKPLCDVGSRPSVFHFHQSPPKLLSVKSRPSVAEREGPPASPPIPTCPVPPVLLCAFFSSCSMQLAVVGSSPSLLLITLPFGIPRPSFFALHPLRTFNLPDYGMFLSLYALVL